MMNTLRIGLQKIFADTAFFNCAAHAAIGIGNIQGGNNHRKKYAERARPGGEAIGDVNSGGLAIAGWLLIPGRALATSG